MDPKNVPADLYFGKVPAERPFVVSQQDRDASVSAGCGTALSHSSFSISLLEQMDQTHGAALTAVRKRERAMGVGTDYI